MTEEQRSIALVGFGTSYRDAPWDDPSWAIWTMNDAPTQFAKRSDAHFDMHHPLIRARSYDNALGRIYLSKLPEIVHERPTYMLDDSIPGAIPYPIDMVISYFKHDYFASSISYMLSFAMMCAETQPNLYAKRIGFWGVEMAAKVEYAREKACFEYWYGRAQERGFELVRPAGSQLAGIAYRYGYSEPRLELVKTQVAKRQADLEQWIGQMSDEERQKTADLKSLHERIAEFRGMLQETEWTLQTQTDTAPNTWSTRG